MDLQKHYCHIDFEKKRRIDNEHNAWCRFKDNEDIFLESSRLYAEYEKIRRDNLIYFEGVPQNKRHIYRLDFFPSNNK